MDPCIRSTGKGPLSLPRLTVRPTPLPLGSGNHGNGIAAPPLESDQQRMQVSPFVVGGVHFPCVLFPLNLVISVSRGKTVAAYL